MKKTMVFFAATIMLLSAVLAGCPPWPRGGHPPHPPHPHHP
jgi:hypothetical protein